MSSKVITAFALFAFAFGVAAADDAVAGEKMKGRDVWYNVKWEQVEVGDEDGHVVAVSESRGIQTCLEGEPCCDGCVKRTLGVYDFNPNTGTGSAHGYGGVTDSDGETLYYSWKAKLGKDGWEGEATLTKGVGKWEGWKGTFAWSSHVVAPKQSYTEWEGEAELPGK